ncbi:hypothetical protein NMY22_g7341 [Coprinellus aureogranulatus]|nr:hypothetical protein NMY22_g7341 [Coprinellus aureogranulatus]
MSRRCKRRFVMKDGTLELLPSINSRGSEASKHLRSQTGLIYCPSYGNRQNRGNEEGGGNREDEYERENARAQHPRKAGVFSFPSLRPSASLYNPQWCGNHEQAARFQGGMRL